MTHFAEPLASRAAPSDDPIAFPAVADPARLAALRRTGLVAAVHDPASAATFDRFASLARRLLNVPVALVSLVEQDRQLFVGCVGLGDGAVRETPIAQSMCQHVVDRRQPVLIEDARIDARVGAGRPGHAAVTELGVVAYLGVPLVTDDGHVLGALCAIDVVPRHWSPDDVDALSDLAESVMAEVDLQHAVAVSRGLARELAANDERQQFLLSLGNQLRPLVNPADIQATAARLLGEHLDAARAYYAEVKPETASIHIAHDYVRAGVASIAGALPLEAFDWIGPAFQTGTPAVEPDVRTSALVPAAQRDALTSIGVASFIAVPFLIDGRLVTILSVTDTMPRAWSADETSVVRDVVERTWVAIERERSQQRLAIERGQLEVVVDQSPAFMAVLRGAEHRYERTNAQHDAMLGGRTRIGASVAEVFPEAVAQGFVAVLDRVLATDEPFSATEMSFAVTREEGAPEERIVNIVFQPLTGVDGQRTGILVQGVDVTEVVRTRIRAVLLQRLTGALASARTLADVAAVVVGLITEEIGARTGALSVPTVDGSALQLVRTTGFGQETEDRMRRQPLLMESPLTHCFQRRTAVWIESRDGTDGLDAQYPRITPVWDSLGTASAAYIPLLLAGDEAVGTISFAFATPHRFSDDERAFYLALGQQTALALDRARLFEAERDARDDAERAQATAVSAQQTAEVANRAKMDFLATMSHELRTPLNAIGGYTDLIQLGVHGPVTSGQTDALDRIGRAQRHLLSLINTVLNYAKVDAGTVHYDIGEINVADMLREAEALVAPQAQAKSLTLTFTGCDPSLHARADREKMQQITLNLLSNATKFTEAGGSITLSCRAGTSASGSAVVLVTVADTGIGIPADQLARIFEPFVQIDSAYTRAQQGTGLGLAISRDLAQAMQGDLTAESTLGRGSTFTLVLPAGGG